MTSTTKTAKTRGHTTLQRKLAVGLPAPPSERWDELPDLDVFLFDERRRFLGNAPSERGLANIEADFGHPRMLRAVIAPRGLAPQTVAKSKSLPCVSLDVHELDAVETVQFPPGWWDELLFGQLVTYHGRVEKVIGESTLPIREGTVEVYEVDPWVWIVKQPELEILRFRDDLLRVLDPPRIPELQREPWPWPDPPPGPEHGPLPVEFAKASLAGVPTPTTPGMNFASNPSFAAAAPGFMAQAPPVGNLHPTVLRNLEGQALRSYLLANTQALTPLLCLLVPDWWYAKDKLGEVAIQPDGTFFGTAGWWRAGLDRHDLYFRVRQVIEGTDTTIYSPSVSGHTWWNYTGSEVVLRVTHPEAVAVEDALVAEDDQVVFLGVGFDTTTDLAGEPGLMQTGTDIGCYRLPSGKLAPYAANLHIVLDVDLYGLRDAGVTFYRLSYRKGQHTTLGSASDWTNLTTPINRHYREITMVGGNPVVSYPVVSLVPTPAEVPTPLSGEEALFKFADPVRDYVVIKRADRAFGIWDTEELPAEGETHGDVAGIYTVRLELFDASGTDVTATTPLLRIHEQEADDTYTTTALDPTQPFVYVHVDNRPMVAEIQDELQAGTSSTGTGCGFLTATAGTDVDVGIRAYHPGGVGVPTDPDRFLSSWHYKVTRGAGALVRIDESVTDKNVGTPVSWHGVPYAPDIPTQTVDHLLQGVVLRGTRQRRCTFNVRLSVYSLARNGYGRLHAMDRADMSSFALIEQP